VIALFERGSPAEQDRSTLDHLALTISREDYESQKRRLEALGLTVKLRITSGCTGGQSISRIRRATQLNSFATTPQSNVPQPLDDADECLCCRAFCRHCSTTRCLNACTDRCARRARSCASPTLAARLTRAPQVSGVGR
jgi:hypothetical protein